MKDGSIINYRWKRRDNMRKFNLFPCCFVMAIFVIYGGAVYAEGRAKIGLKPEVDAEYISDSSNPWFDDSWVSSSQDFNLDITSLTKSSSIYNTNLVLAIPNDTEDNNEWSFTLGGTEFDYESFTGTGLHPYLAPHGVFAKENGALWFEYSLGTLAQGQTISLPFSGTNLPHAMLLHFDAYGSSSETDQNGWYFNAYSHDTTVTPEPISSALFLTGGMALAMRRLIRKRTK